MKILLVLAGVLSTSISYADSPRVLKAGDYYVFCTEANGGETPGATMKLNQYFAAPSIKNGSVQIDKPYTVVNTTVSSAGDNQAGFVWDACALIKKD